VYVSLFLTSSISRAYFSFVIASSLSLSSLIRPSSMSLIVLCAANLSAANFFAASTAFLFASACFFAASSASFALASASFLASSRFL